MALVVALVSITTASVTVSAGMTCENVCGARNAFNNGIGSKFGSVIDSSFRNQVSRILGSGFDASCCGFGDDCCKFGVKC